MKILSPDLFSRKALAVAPELLGKFLVRKTEDGETARMITEVEAYVGPHDLASHSSRGKTPRNAAMYLPGGHWYVYFVYGRHWMLNIVTDGPGYPSAVLIRGVEGASGPGRVGKLYGIGRGDYGLAASKESGLYIEDRGIVVAPKNIVRAARIGVDYAGPVWSRKKYNFKLKKRSKMTFPGLSNKNCEARPRI